MAESTVTARASLIAIGMLSTESTEERQRIALDELRSESIVFALDVFERVSRILADAFISANGGVLPPERVAELQHDARFWQIASDYETEGEDG